jgi:phosphate transport system protein
LDQSRRRTNREYEFELQQVRRKLVVMAERVQKMTLKAVRSLVERNSELAAEVILEDREVNREEVETDELCMLILAKRQPMASDLRFVTIAMKMVTDIERIGDLAVNIAERAITLNGQAPIRPYNDIPRTADIVSTMLHEAITAFLDQDVELAEKVVIQDDEVDELYHKIFRDILELMNEDPDAVRPGIDLQSVAKFLERMADHVTNLAELVIYMARGKDVRHLGKRQ